MEIRQSAVLRALVVFNPTAGRRRRRILDETTKRMEAMGAKVVLQETLQPGDAERFAREAKSDDYDLVVAAGGDGTINEVLNGLVAADAGLALGVVPLGTANVLACEIGLAARAEAIAHTIIHGRRQQVRLGLANGRHFLLMAGAGIDAHVVAGVDLLLKRRTGKLAYVWESVRQALKYDFPWLEVTVDGETHQARMVVVCNGRCYGGPFVAAPAARLDEPQLYALLLNGSGLGSVLRYGIALALGRLPQCRDVTIHPARSVTINGLAGAPVQGDGDVIATLPVTMIVADTTLEVMVPG